MVCGGRVATTVLLYAHPVRRVSVQRPERVRSGPDRRREPLAPVLVHDLAATATVGAGGRHLVHHPRLPSVRFHLHPHRRWTGGCHHPDRAVHLRERVRLTDPVRHGHRGQRAAVPRGVHPDRHQLDPRPPEGGSMTAPAPTNRQIRKQTPGRTWTTTGTRRVTATDALRVVILSTFVLLALIPVVWTLLGSFKTPAELAARPITILPENWGLDNYTDALGRFNFTVYLRNSVLVTVGATVLTLTINAMAAYGLAKYNFRGRNGLFLLTLATIMIPLQVILIPVYHVVASMGLVNTLCGLIIPAAATPTGVFILRQYMLGIPGELIEAARVDGSGEFRTFLRIVLPLCRPALAVVAILSVMWRWNDFLWPLVVAQSEGVYTLPVALARFNAEETVPFNLILAMSVVTIVPVILLFLVFQRQITTGIANTGIK